MITSLKHEDTSCRQCSLQSVQFASEDADKHKLFHELCRDCDGDEANSTHHVALCDSCHHLRLQHLLLCCIQPGDGKGLYVCFTPTRKEEEKCALCHFIASSVPPDEEVEIRISDSDGMCFLETRDESIPLFAEKRGLLTRRVSEYVQWPWLRQALQEASETEPDQHAIFSSLGELEDVRVIDVSQACVAQLPQDLPYAALSYVWGADSGNQLQATMSNIHNLEEPNSLKNADLPQTILDTFKVCEELDLRYLWVDRLCILQDDSWQRKSIQLNQMAKIYARAKLTVVAAAGDGASFGLPGVSRPRTVIQETLRLNDFFGLVYGTKNLESCLKESKWYQRGWT